MKTIALEGQERNDLGKTANKALKTQGLVPAVLYGGDEVIHFSVSAKAVRPLIYSADFKTAELTVAGKSYYCILKDKQFHPVSDAIQHLDFMQLVDGNTIKVQVPIRFTGSAPGVKEGGTLQQNLRMLKIKTTPENLIDEMTADVSELTMGQSIRVRDIKAAKGIEIMNAMSIPIASIEVPRALRSAESAAEGLEGEEGTETEGETATEE